MNKVIYINTAHRVDAPKLFDLIGAAAIKEAHLLLIAGEIVEGFGCIRIRLHLQGSGDTFADRLDEFGRQLCLALMPSKWGYSRLDKLPEGFKDHVPPLPST